MTKQTTIVVIGALRVNNPIYWARGNYVDLGQMPQNMVYDQGLQCGPLIKQVLDTSADSKMDLFKF